MLKVSFNGFPHELSEMIFKGLSNQNLNLFFLRSENVKDSDIHFEFNFDKGRIKPQGKYNVLILWEPQSYMPWQYKKSVLEKFNLVIPMSRWRAEKLKLKNWAFHPGQIKSLKVDEKTRTKNIVMINAAKFSANFSSNYGLRRDISKKLFALNLGYELYGQNWNMPKFKEFRERIWSIRKEVQAFNIPDLFEAFSNISYRYPEYRGPTVDKFLELSRFRYALVIENESDWITEKLFDAISAGCVPIYIGPDLAQFPILSKCTIQLKPSVNSVLDYFRNVNEDSYLAQKQLVDQVRGDSKELEIFLIENISLKIAKITFDNYHVFENGLAH